MSDADQSALLRFSTDPIPVQKRVKSWRDVFGRRIANIDVEPLTDDPFHFEATMLAISGLRMGWCSSATPAVWKRPPDLVKDGDDDYAFIMPLTGTMVRTQCGRELKASAGEAFGILQTEPARMLAGVHQYFAVMLPRAGLLPLVPNLDDAATRLIPSSNEALRLLRNYLPVLRESRDVSDPTLRHLVSTHVNDLVALAIGPKRDGAFEAKRGLRAGRLHAIKTYILANLNDQQLSVGTVALHERITPRYVHKLLEAEGTAFSEYVLAHRLQRTHQTLSDPRYSGMTITDIALAAGFGDLSYFYRTFRRHFGATPSDVRHGISWMNERRRPDQS